MQVESLHHPRLVPLPAFADNYVWLVRAAAGSACAVVDPGDADVVLRYADRHGLEVRHVLLTHHHADHVGGVAALRAAGAHVIGPRRETIAGIDFAVGDGDPVELTDIGLTLRTLDVPGHTAGHVAYFGNLDRRPLLFCGDTLFSAGCGRLFEGSPSEMSASLSRIAALPPETLVCCAHEYTLANLRFAAAVEPDNADITAVTDWAHACRTQNLPTLPSELRRELAINPFLRTEVPAVVRAAESRAGNALPDRTAVFAVLRRWKDGFR